MSLLSGLSFSFQQTIAILGMSQAIYALVYMLSRAGGLARAWMVILYFLILTFALLCDFSLDFFRQYKDGIFFLGSGLWLALPIFSFLISIQIIYIEKFPKIWQISTVFFLIAIINGLNIYGFIEKSEDAWGLTNLISIVSGSILLFLTVLIVRSARDLWQSKSAGKQRYWLVICLILSNSGLVALVLFEQLGFLEQADLIISRSLMACVFTYLVSTSLFRIYPQAVFLNQSRSPKVKNPEMIEKLNQVFERDKLYQEQNFGRRELAQELSVSEAVASELVNSVYKKSIPQLLKEYRIEDAKVLLKQTRLTVQDVAKESGFGSLTSFNRTFQEVEGCTPTKFRRN